MRNYKGGYVILDLGEINTELESGEIADDTIFSTNFNGKQLKEKILELVNIRKPILALFKLFGTWFYKFIDISIGSSSCYLKLKEQVSIGEDYSVDGYVSQEINYEFHTNKVYYYSIDI